MNPRPRLPESVSLKAALAAGSCITLLLASTAGLAGFFFGRGSPAQTGTVDPALEGPESGAVLLEWEGRKFAPGDFPAPVLEKLTAADARLAEGIFQARYNHAREKDNVLRNYVVGELARKESESRKIGLEEATRKLIQPEPVDLQDARSLFEASDPSAPAREFDRVKGELLAYIEEVSRREAADRLLRDLEKAERLKVHLRPPRKDGHRFSLEGYPSVGRKEAPFTLVNFTDFLCDDCPAYNLELSGLVVKHGLAARFVFIPFPYTRPDKAMGLARGAMCAQEIGSYLDYHMQVVSLGTHARKAHPMDVARTAGLDMGAFTECYRKGTGVAGLLQGAQEEARRAGVMTVPVSFLEGRAFEGSEGLAALSRELDAKKN